MNEDKIRIALQEVDEEIISALKDPRGLIPHQRRLAFCLSFGATALLELHFHKLNVIKPGSKINHLLFRKQEKAISEILERQITSPLPSIANMSEIIGLMINIEEKRDDLAYGAPVPEQALQDKINLFFKLREVLKC